MRPVSPGRPGIARKSRLASPVPVQAASSRHDSFVVRVDSA